MFVFKKKDAADAPEKGKKNKKGKKAVQDANDAPTIDPDASASTDAAEDADIFGEQGGDEDASDEVDEAELEREIAEDEDYKEQEKFDNETQYIVEERRGTRPLFVGISVLSVIVALGLGFASCLFYFYNTYKGADTQIAWRATRAAVDYIGDVIQYPDDLTVFDVYVREEAHDYNCVIFGTIKYKVGEYKNNVFHIVLNKDDKGYNVEDDVEFDQSLYDQLMSGGDIDRLQAGVIANYHEGFKKSLLEIENGDAGWIHASDAYVNLQLIASGDSWREQQAKKREAAQKETATATTSSDAETAAEATQ